MNKELLNWLSSKGMHVMRNAIETKGKEWVEDLIKIKFPTDLANIQKGIDSILKQAEMEYEEQLLNVHLDAVKEALENKKLDVEIFKSEVDNTKDARLMNSRIQEAKAASEISKVAAYYLDFSVVGFTLLASLFLFFIGVPAANEKLAYMALGSLLTLTGTIINFHRGTSAGSKSKDSVIEILHGRNKGGE